MVLENCLERIGRIHESPLVDHSGCLTEWSENKYGFSPYFSNRSDFLDWKRKYKMFRSASLDTRWHYGVNERSVCQRSTHLLIATVRASAELAHGQMTSGRRPLLWKTLRNASHDEMDPVEKQREHYVPCRAFKLYYSGYNGNIGFEMFSCNSPSVHKLCAVNLKVCLYQTTFSVYLKWEK